MALGSAATSFRMRSANCLVRLFRSSSVIYSWELTPILSLQNRKSEIKNLKSGHGLSRLQISRIKNNYFPHVDACLYLNPIRSPPAGGDGFLDCFSILDHDHFFNSRKRHESAAGHGHRRAGLIGDDLSFDERAGTEAAVVRDVGFDNQDAILLADRWAQTLDVTDIRIRIAFGGDTDALAVANVVRLALGNFGAQPQWVDAHQINDRRAGGEILSGARFLLLHDAVHRGIDNCVGELLLRERQL